MGLWWNGGVEDGFVVMGWCMSACTWVTPHKQTVYGCPHVGTHTQGGGEEWAGARGAPHTGVVCAGKKELMFDP